MALKIETWKDNPVLRTVCEKIKQSEWKQYSKLWKEMVAYIKNPDHAGVWLAAPQVWITKRIMVVSLLRDWDDETFSTVMMINPELLESFHWNDKRDRRMMSLTPKSKKRLCGAPTHQLNFPITMKRWNKKF